MEDGWEIRTGVGKLFSKGKMVNILGFTAGVL